MANGSIAFPKYVYPPFFAVVLQPLVGLSFSQAKTLWFIANIGLLGTTIVLLSTLFHWTRWAAVGIGIATLLLPPFYDTLLLGQVSILVLALVTLTLVLSLRLRSATDILAGVCLGLAVSIKFYPICLLLPYLCVHRYRVVGATLVTVMLTFVVGSFVPTGLQATIVFFSTVLPSVGGISPLPVNQSVWSVFLRFFTPTSFQYAFLSTDNLQTLTLRPLLNLPFAAVLSSVILTIALWSATLWAITRRTKLMPHDHYAHGLSLTIAALLATSPVTHDHYATLLLIPLAYLGSQTIQQRSITHWRGYFVILSCLFLVLQRYWRIMLNIVPSPLVTCFGLLAILTIWLALISEQQQAVVTTQ